MTIYRTRRRFLSSDELDQAAREISESAGAAPVAAAGGYAMQAYGSDRLTVDLDVLATRVPPGLTKTGRLTFGGYTTKTRSGTPVDVIMRDDDLRRLYRDAITHSVRVRGFPIRIVSLGYLVAMKMDAGRTKDDADLEFLLANLSPSEKAKVRRVVLEYLGPYAAHDFDGRVAEAEWLKRRDPAQRRRRRSSRRFLR